MKKIILAILCSFFFTGVKATVTAKNIVVTKGRTVTLSIAEDLGYQLNYHYSYIWGMSYVASDNIALSIVPHEYALDTSSRYFYTTYDLTPQQTGSYTFTITYSYSTNYSTSPNNTFIYNITVVDVTAISMSQSLSLFIGDEYTLTPTIVQVGAETTLTWISSNTSVATVSADGVISAVGIGTTTITCIAHNGVSAQCEVTVNPVNVSSITLNKTEAELVAGDKLQLEATIVPDNATNKSLSWSSTNEAVAVVSENGLVTAVGSGFAQIKATANDGSGRMGSCQITVLGNVIYCEDFAAVPKAVITLPIQLTNADAIQGFEFKLVLPNGISVQTDNDGNFMTTLTERATTQGLGVSNQGNGVYQFVFTSSSRLQGNSGSIVNVPLVVANDMELGLYDVIIKDVELVKYGTSSIINHGDRTAILSVKPMTIGDVNGDGRVSVADAISIINYVLGRTPVSFITEAAYVNDDSVISLGDAVATVDLILAGSGENVRQTKRPVVLDPQ